ncbi:GMP synthase [Hymenobacter sp. BRD128]|uniref:type 1 glutamine amidotransferase n=1 Tax=Hymenobacter sp. BRD128 TaxID=2675878 RepID=UPI001564892B|nr:GMP synthase [Hymenobacter sp. BRD128]QKG56691.1 GMP synthase [Hymenobacter sp. BRD128]
MSQFKVAILDMYNNFPNEGMRCIRQLLHRTELNQGINFHVDTFNVRAINEVPGLEYDIYLSSGGPGSPLASTEPWESLYFGFIDALFAYNQQAERKKHLLLICHSFQLVSRHLGLGEVSKRKSTSFGVLPVHLTATGHRDPLFEKLPNPFFAVDSRDYQLTGLYPERLSELGIEVLCLEKERPHVPLARAIMALRFSPEVVGTQFHPEADGEGMLRYMLTDERKQQVINAYGEDKYHEMVRLLATPGTIDVTENTIVPTFLQRALAALREPVLV